MIQGYPAKSSVWPGNELVLHVSSTFGRFRVAFYRWTERLVHVFTSGWLNGIAAPAGSPATSWDWPRYRFQIPADWPGGVYIAHLEEPDALPPHLAMEDASALFIIRSRSARLLYKLPLATYNAYNHAGGGCFYDNPSYSDDPPGARLTFLRPGVGIGGPVFGAPDFYDRSSPRQTFAHWDARFLRWLHRSGYAADICSDLDIHNDPQLCRAYRLLAGAGHDEYWSEPGRNAVEAFIAEGGNAAFFSGNLCWWRIHLVDQGSAMVCHQGGPQGARDHWWPASGGGRPEDALAGVSYRHGGGWWDGPRSSNGYMIVAQSHWVFAGTGLKAGATLGTHTIPPLVGYECDGAPLAYVDRSAGTAILSRMATDCGTPPQLQMLAVCPLDAQWQELPAREPFLGAASIHAATMGIVVRAGRVFTAGTTDWAQVLDSDQEPRVATITHNVLREFLGAGSAAP